MHINFAWKNIVKDILCNKIANLCVGIIVFITGYFGA